MLYRLMILVSCLLALSLPGAFAQPAGPPPAPDIAPAEASPDPKDGQEDAQDVRELVESIRIAKLSREVGLNEEQTVLLMRRHQENREQMGKLQKRRYEQLRLLREAVEQSAPDEQLLPLIEQLRNLDQETMRLYQEAAMRSAEGLTVTQQAKLYIFMNTFDHDMRRLVERARKNRGVEGKPDQSSEKQPRTDSSDKRDMTSPPTPDKDTPEPSATPKAAATPESSTPPES